MTLTVFCSNTLNIQHSHATRHLCDDYSADVNDQISNCIVRMGYSMFSPGEHWTVTTEAKWLLTFRFCCCQLLLYIWKLISVKFRWYAIRNCSGNGNVSGVRKRQRLTGTAKRQRKNGNGMLETGHNSDEQWLLLRHPVTLRLDDVISVAVTFSHSFSYFRWL